MPTPSSRAGTSGGLRPIVLLIPFKNGNVARIEIPGDTPPARVEALRREFVHQAAYYESKAFQDSLPREARSGAGAKRPTTGPPARPGARQGAPKPGSGRRGTSEPPSRFLPIGRATARPGWESPVPGSRDPGILAPVDPRAFSATTLGAPDPSPLLATPTLSTPRDPRRPVVMPEIGRTTPRRPIVTDPDFRIDPRELDAPAPRRGAPSSRPLRAPVPLRRPYTYDPATVFNLMEQEGRNISERERQRENAVDSGEIVYPEPPSAEEVAAAQIRPFTREELRTGRRIWTPMTDAELRVQARGAAARRARLEREDRRRSGRPDPIPGWHPPMAAPGSQDPRPAPTPIATRLLNGVTGRPDDQEAWESRQRVRAIMAHARETGDLGMTWGWAKRLEAERGADSVAFYRRDRSVNRNADSPTFDAARAAVTNGGQMRSPDQNRGQLGGQNTGKRLRQVLGGATIGIGRAADAALGRSYSDAIVRGVAPAERDKALSLYYDAMGTTAMALPSAISGLGMTTPLLRVLNGPGMAAVRTLGGTIEPLVTLSTSKDPEELAEAKERLWQPLLTTAAFGGVTGAARGALANRGLGARAMTSGALRGIPGGVMDEFNPFARSRPIEARPEVPTGARMVHPLESGPFSNAAAARATERIAERRRKIGGATYGSLFSPALVVAHGASQLPDHVIQAGNYYLNHGHEFEAWAEEVVRKGGPVARQQLRQAWRQGTVLADRHNAAFDAAQRAAFAADPGERPYAEFKRSDIPSLFGPGDADASRFKDADGKWKYVASVVESDRARADGYRSSRTGAVAPAHGGLGYALGVDEHGRIVWVNRGSGIQTKLARREAAAMGLYRVKPLTLLTLNSQENTLNSHGAGILRSELERAVERGDMSEREALELFNGKLQDITGGKIRPARSLSEITTLLAPGRISMTNQGKVIRGILSPNHRYGLPSWQEAAHDVNDTAFAGLPNGTIAGAFYADPHATDVLDRFGIEPHPYYPDAMGGIMLGATNRHQPVTALDFKPDHTTDRMNRLMRQGRVFSEAERTNALNRSLVRRSGAGGLLLIPDEEFPHLYGATNQRRVAPRTRQDRR